jgi:hypothetical protein
MLTQAKRVLKNIRIHDEPEAKSKFQQIRELFLLALRYRFSPLEYEAYGFFRKNKNWESMLEYMSNYEVTKKLRRPLYDQRMLVLLNNKMLFNRFFGSFGLPLPAFYGFLHPESGFMDDGSPLCSIKDLTAWLHKTDTKEFFIKSAGGMQGLNIMAINNIIRDGDIPLCEDASGQKWSPEALYRHLLDPNQGKKMLFPGYIVEELVKQHPAISQINPSSVNTCRILTLRNMDNSIDVLSAFIRFGRLGTIIDNLHQGGIAAGIDVETGQLRKASYSPLFGAGSTEVHPDTLFPLVGFQLPYWPEAKELVQKAAAVTPGIKSIGWDIAITKEGPTLIEGNSSWGPLAIQQTDQGLLTPKFRDKFKQYGLDFR